MFEEQEQTHPPQTRLPHQTGPKDTSLTPMVKPVVLRSREDLRAWCNNVRGSHESVGFVPTMGALHAGHRSLAQASRARGLVTVASIFVNPSPSPPPLLQMTNTLSCRPR